MRTLGQRVHPVQTREHLRQATERRREKDRAAAVGITFRQRREHGDGPGNITGACCMWEKVFRAIFTTRAL